MYIRNNVPAFSGFHTDSEGVFVLPPVLRNDMRYYEKDIPVSCSFTVSANFYIGRLRTVQWADETACNRLFDELYKKWREETRFDSFIGDPDHKSYDKIAQLGYRVVPCIISKLKEEPSLVFTALVRITRENPVKDENRGIVRKMAEDWIDWWEKKHNAAGCSDA